MGYSNPVASLGGGEPFHCDKIACMIRVTEPAQYDEATDGMWGRYHTFYDRPASDNASVWVAEQPGYTAQPWHRVRLLSSAGEIKQEVPCALGHSFEIVPYCDSVIRGNLLVTPIAARGSS